MIIDGLRRQGPDSHDEFDSAVDNALAQLGPDDATLRDMAAMGVDAAVCKRFLIFPTCLRCRLELLRAALCRSSSDESVRNGRLSRQRFDSLVGGACDHKDGGKWTYSN